MPTYEYKCSACGHAFERFQSMSAEPIKRCPECGKAKVKRLIGTGAGLIFKGSGFYITDYRDSAYKDKAKAEAGASGGSESKSESGAAVSSKSGGDSAAATTPAAPAAGGAEAKPEASKSSAKPASKSQGKSRKKSS